MATYKRIEGDFFVNNTQLGNVYTGNIHFTTNTVKVFGNLDVSGNVTYINVSELNIRDPFILLNSSNTNSYSANTGMLVHKTETDFAGIRWSNVANSWQLSSSTSSSGETGVWVNLLTAGSAAAGANTEIQFNDDGDFGASSGLTFDTAANTLGITGVISLQGHQIFGNIGAAPANVANSAVMYHDFIGGGNTGVYVRTVNSTDELVAKRRAIAFGLIF
jgi:hypothetical protein